MITLNTQKLLKTPKSRMALLSYAKQFAKEGIVLEWVYDRGKLNGKLIFRW